MFLGVAWLATGDYERGGPMLLRGVELMRRAGSPSLATGLAHAARLALHDGDRTKARTLLEESLKLPTSNKPLRVLVAAEILLAEGGCAAARGKLIEALDFATADGQHYSRVLATDKLVTCLLAAGDTSGARQRIEPMLAWLEKGSADAALIMPLRAAVAKLPL
jgi:hypothetical protein